MPFPRRAVLFAVALLALSGRAFAQGSAADADKARDLFKEAVVALDKGDYAFACPRFRAAMLLFASPSTQINIAKCLEHEGKLASAAAAYQQALVLNRDTKDPERREGLQTMAGKAAAALEARVPKLRIIVPEEVRGLPGLAVERNGIAVDRAAWGAAVPTDKGRYVVTVAATGRTRWEKTVEITADGAETVMTVGPVAEVGSSSEAPPAPSGPSGQRVAAYVTGGVGIVGLVVGGVFGGLTLKKVGDSKSQGHCDADLRTCDAIGLELQHDAKTTANVSNVMLAVGGAALVAGVVLFATAPAASGAAAPKNGARVTVRTVAGGGMTGLLVQGRW